MRAQKVIIKLMKNGNGPRTSANRNRHCRLKTPSTEMVRAIAQPIQNALECTRDTHKMYARPQDKTIIVGQHIKDIIDNILMNTALGHISVFFQLAACSTVVTRGVALPTAMQDINPDTFLLKFFANNLKRIIRNAFLIMTTIKR